MSSAVVQPQHPQQIPSPARDRYLSSSPASRRTARPTNPNAPLSNTPQPTTYTPPVSTSAMSTPRPAEPLSSSTYQQFFPDPAVPGPAVALPARTSSQNATASPQSYEPRVYTSKTGQPGSGVNSDMERERSSDNERRQRQQKSPQDSSRGSRPRQAPVQSRSSTAIGQPPVDTSLPRENSAIIQHIVVDDPQSDLAREKARVAESRPTPAGTEGGAPPMTDQSIPPDPEKLKSRQEFRQPSNRKEVKFGDYILGQTLGEGEFGKVKMGWKRDSSVQVAIKLIRKESLQSNSNRLPKIYREISILRELQHPNIVRLHEFVETERHMGIILEYASGGELFDYILNHRYLKDPAARRLFAQLVSGVGYLHKKGIVHRDLKLENLLLDRNRNIIITDFGFANTFNPHDELSEEMERNITDKEFVKREGLDKVDERNQRRGDLMQTSCGSPCYAAPELVVSDGLYTGRKVDVWSCGVILYAMLAGYLPFDDDPANPEGDNINLLYKYIVSTPLTFPEYVTPHARDLLRQILVPDPRRRADLFIVARHSWLSEYSHVVGFIGSSTKSDRDIAASAMQQGSEPLLGRSASVREQGRPAPPMSAGGIPKQTANNSDSEDARNQQRDAKRRTVQLEYVPPKNETVRGEIVYPSAAVPTNVGRTKARGDAHGPVEVSTAPTANTSIPRKEVPAQGMAPPTTTTSRPVREPVRATSESVAVHMQGPVSHSRPNTSGTLGLPSRGNSYSQPALATPTTTNAQGRFSQPKSNSSYMISAPLGSDQLADSGRPVSQQHLGQYGHPQPGQGDMRPSQRSHKRSSTLGSIGDRLLGRSSSRRRESQSQDHQPAVLEKRDRKYPPVSMRNAMPAGAEDYQPRPSTESSRRTSFGFNRKNSESTTATGSGTADSRRNSRRFSFLPSLTGRSKDASFDPDPYGRRPESKSGGPNLAFGRGASRSPSRSTTNSTIPLYYEPERDAIRSQRGAGNNNSNSYKPTNSNKALPPQPGQTPPPVHRKQWRDDGYGSNILESRPSASQFSHQPASHNDPVERFFTPSETLDPQHQQQGGYYTQHLQQQQAQQPDQQQPPHSSSSDGGAGPEGTTGYEQSANESNNPHLRPSQRKFANEFDHGYGGSSSATRRVMDFFRRRGKERSDL